MPVSTEISVKGGKGIWGMPKHQASLDFLIEDDSVSSQYDLDGQLAMRVTLNRPARANLSLPMSIPSVNYCAFRGMLMKSYIYFKGKMGMSLFKNGAATLLLGDHPRMQPLKALEISPNPIFAAYFPETQGVLDDHFEGWFLTEPQPPAPPPPEGLESVINLGLGQQWPPPPNRLGLLDIAGCAVVEEKRHEAEHKAESTQP